MEQAIEIKGSHKKWISDKYTCKDVELLCTET